MLYRKELFMDEKEYEDWKQTLKEHKVCPGVKHDTGKPLIADMIKIINHSYQNFARFTSTEQKHTDEETGKSWKTVKNDLPMQ